MKIVDLTVKIGRDTYSPPSVNQPIGIEEHYKEPGFWMVSEITLMLHSGSHVDFTKHHTEDGETAESVLLERTCGEAVIVDLSPLEPDHDISPTDLDSAGTEIRPGDIVLIRTVWSDRAARWLVDTGARPIGFDCFPERAAKRQYYRPTRSWSTGSWVTPERSSCRH